MKGWWIIVHRLFGVRRSRAKPHINTGCERQCNRVAGRRKDRHSPSKPFNHRRLHRRWRVPDTRSAPTDGRRRRHRSAVGAGEGRRRGAHGRPRTASHAVPNRPAEQPSDGWRRRCGNRPRLCCDDRRSTGARRNGETGRWAYVISYYLDLHSCDSVRRIYVRLGSGMPSKWNQSRRRFCNRLTI